MSDAAFILIVGAVMGLSFVRLCMAIWPTRSPERKPDYRRINEAELELGLPLSDYRAQGVDAIAMLEQRSIVMGNDTQRVIERLDDRLNPEQALRKKVSAAFAVPPHVLLEGCPACGGSLYHPTQPCSMCGWCTSVRVMHVMDAPYPIEVIPSQTRRPAGGGP